MVSFVSKSFLPIFPVKSDFLSWTFSALMAKVNASCKRLANASGWRSKGIVWVVMRLPFAMPVRRSACSVPLPESSGVFSS